MKKKRKSVVLNHEEEAAPQEDPAETSAPRRKKKLKKRAVEDASVTATSSAVAEQQAAPPRKRVKKRGLPEPARKPPSESSLSDGDDDEEGEEEEDDQDGGNTGDDDFDVDFELCDPCEDDYHGVRDLIKSGTWAFVGNDLNFPELVDSICGQGNIGTIVMSGTKGEENANACGLRTLLNLRQFAHQSWPKTIGNALIAKAKKYADPPTVEKLQALLNLTKKEGSEVGLFFSERFVNVPPVLIPPLHKALVDDIEWSCSTPECPEDERPFYKFAHFLYVTRCRNASAAASSTRGGKRKKNRQQADEVVNASINSANKLVCFRPEDEPYLQRAAFSFSFPAPTETSGSDAPSERGRASERILVFALARKAFERAVPEVEAACQAPEE